MKTLRVVCILVSLANIFIFIIVSYFHELNQLRVFAPLFFVATIVFSVMLARKLNRSPILWGFLSFIMPFLSPAVLAIVNDLSEGKRIDIGTNSISKRLHNMLEKVDLCIAESHRYFIFSNKTISVTSHVLSTDYIKEELSKVSFGLHGQYESWKTGAFQGQKVTKQQLLSGLNLLFSSLDEIITAWNIYVITGDGMKYLNDVKSSLSQLILDSQMANFPN